MIRIHFAEREPIDIDANQVEFTAAGGVTFHRVDVRLETNPQNIKETRMVASNPQFLWAFSAAAKWTKVENIEPDHEETLSIRPLEASTR